MRVPMWFSSVLKRNKSAKIFSCGQNADLCCDTGRRFTGISDIKVLPLVLACIMFSVSGCGISSKSTQSVMWEAPVKLTAGEEKAFNTTSTLDRGLSEKGKKAVKKEMARLLHENRKHTIAVGRRSAKYLAQSREIFRKHGLPEELACLAIVESGFNTQAMSRSGAAGAWQFMPATGRSYGLVQDAYMDERLDPYKSGDAAARYLKKLYSRFNNWHLAVAAYNAGEGKIQRAVNASGKKDFFELAEKNSSLSPKLQLKKETLDYVPRLLAISKIIHNMDEVGLSSLDREIGPRMQPLTAAANTDLTAVARACGMSWTDFKGYNAAHKQKITAANRSTTVYVPEAKMQLVASGLRSGAYAASGRKNTQIASASRTNNAAASQKRPVRQTAALAEVQRVHVVQNGDSLWRIAKKYNVKPQDVMKWNKISGGMLRPGDRLIVSM